MRAGQITATFMQYRSAAAMLAAGRLGRAASQEPNRRPPISAFATTRAAGSGSRLATRMPRAGPPKAGGTCRRAPARPWSRASWWRASITFMRSTTTAAANGRARPSCARATRNSPSAGSKIASRAAMIAPASSRSTPPSSASWTVQLTEFDRAGAEPAAAAIYSADPDAPGRLTSPPSRNRPNETAAPYQDRRNAWPGLLGSGHDRAPVRGGRRRVPHQYEPHLA